MASLNDIATRTSNLEKNKLNLSGGLMSGYLEFSGTGSYNLIRGGKKDGAITTTDGSDGANLIIQSWYGVGFRTSCPKCGNGSTTLAIDTRSGNLFSKGTINGSKVYNAVWNDYAEFFERGEETEVGDIIALDENSDEERYIKATSESKVIVGVHSDTFAHLIGGENPTNGEDFYEYNIKKFIPVGLAGRVKVKVIGPIKKGDLITISPFDAGVGVSINNHSEKYCYCVERII